MPKTGELVNEIVGPLKISSYRHKNYICFKDAGNPGISLYEMDLNDFAKCASLLINGEFNKDIKWQWICKGGSKWLIRPSFLVPKRSRTTSTIKGVIRTLANGTKVFRGDYRYADEAKIVDVPKEIKATFKLHGRIVSNSETYLYYKAIDCSEKQLEKVCILFTLGHIMEKFDMTVPKEFTSQIELKKKTWIRGIIKTDQLESWTHTEYVPKKD